jgi:hypothetical protein
MHASTMEAHSVEMLWDPPERGVPVAEVPTPLESAVQKLDCELIELQLLRRIRFAMARFRFAAGIGFLIALLLTLYSVEIFFSQTIFCMMTLADAAAMSRAMELDIQSQERRVSDYTGKLEEQLERSAEV